MMKRSSTILVRMFALLNLAFAVVQVYLLIAMSVASVPRFALMRNTAPRALLVYIVDTTIVGAFLCGFVYSAVALLRIKLSAVKMVCLLYVCELLYLVLTFFVIPALPLSQSWRTSVLTGQIAVVSLMPQVSCGYPLVALIAMTLISRVERQRRKNQVWRDFAS